MFLCGVCVVNNGIQPDPTTSSNDDGIPWRFVVSEVFILEFIMINLRININLWVRVIAMETYDKSVVPEEVTRKHFFKIYKNF